MKISELFKKENIYKVLVVGFVLVFIFSSFSIDFFGNKKENQNTSDYFQVETIVNATIIEYQSYIITNLRNDSIAQSLKTFPNVENVISTSQGYVISLKNTSNITGFYTYLSSQNISGMVNAFLSLPPIIELSIANSSKNISGSQIYTKLEPIFEEGENITIRVILAVQNKQIIGNGLATILPSQKEFTINATIIALAATKTIISIPWEKRMKINENITNITAKYGAGKISYSKKDYIFSNISNFTSNKPVYVTFISADTIYVGNFTNKTQIENDFKNVSFPDSLLTINANARDELENFTKIYNYIYNIRINNTKQIFTALASSNYYKQNDTINVIVSAYTIKNKITNIINVREIERTKTYN